MTFPTTVYVIMQNDREGNPRGFHKASIHYWIDPHEAEQAKGLYPYGEVQECVIMGRHEYDRLVGPATLPMEL